MKICKCLLMSRYGERSMKLYNRKEKGYVKLLMLISTKNQKDVVLVEAMASLVYLLKRNLTL